jgi:hypothetical protein
VGNIAMRHQVLRRGDDLRYPGLIVCAKQGAAGCGDDVVADAIRQRRAIGWPQHRGRIVRKDEVDTVVATVHDRLHVRPTHSGDVSTCAMKPIVGTCLLDVDGMVAVT